MFIIIYNLSGLLIAVIGAVLGIGTLLATTSFTLGSLVAGGVWIGAGLWWRKGTSGIKRPWPSIFFIPTPVWGLVLVILGGALGIGLDIAMRSRASDPRSDYFQLVESELRQSATSGNPQIANSVLNAVMTARYPGIAPEDTRVAIDQRDDAILVLVQVKNLSKFATPARVQMLDAIDKILNADESLKGKKRYFGLRGRFAYGAVRSPGENKVEGLVSSANFVDFYGPKPRPAQPADARAKP